MFPVVPDLDASVVAEHPYLFAALALGPGIIFVGYRLLREAFYLAYGMWVTSHTPEHAAVIIDATLPRSRRRREPPPKGG